MHLRTGVRLYSMERAKGVGKWALGFPAVAADNALTAVEFYHPGRYENLLDKSRV